MTDYLRDPFAERMRPLIGLDGTDVSINISVCEIETVRAMTIRLPISAEPLADDLRALVHELDIRRGAAAALHPDLVAAEVTVPLRSTEVRLIRTAYDRIRAWSTKTPADLVTLSIDLDRRLGYAQATAAHADEVPIPAPAATIPDGSLRTPPAPDWDVPDIDGDVDGDAPPSTPPPVVPARRRAPAWLLALALIAAPVILIAGWQYPPTRWVVITYLSLLGAGALATPIVAYWVRRTNTIN